MPRILITSVGSLVGQVVLDSLSGRRDDLTVIGSNLSADSPNNFRCDRVHLVPPTDAPGFTDAMVRLCEQENPTLIIPGRDPDLLILSDAAQTNSFLRSRLLAGSVEMADMMSDKAATARFSRQHNLPFADSVAMDSEDAVAMAQELAKQNGFPLIAKPSRGSGSVGVRVLLNQQDLDAVTGTNGLLVQPFLDPPDELTPPTGAGVPLFWEIVEDRLHGVQVLIRRDGSIGESFAFRSKMVRGRCEYLERVDDDDLFEVALAFANRVAEEGWRGPFNVQAKRDRRGSWKVIELNGRFSGGTSARRHLGFDEVALVINGFFGEPVVPVYPPTKTRRVVRQFTDHGLDEEAIAVLETEGTWRA